MADLGVSAMTLAAACGWSLARSLVVALAAWPMCRAQTRWLRSLPTRSRHVMWWALLLPFLCPELWAGYAWSGFAVRLAGTGLWDLLPAGLFPTPQSIVARDAAIDEILLGMLLFFRAVPVGTLALYFAPPPPLSREALYCHALATGQAFPSDAMFRPQVSTVPEPRQSAGQGAALRDASAATIGASNDGSHSHLPRAGTSRWSSLGHPTAATIFGGSALGWNPKEWARAFCFRLESLSYALRSNLYSVLPAMGLMYLVGFQEFELASLIGRPAWTVWLFDAQVGGLALSESLRKTVVPVICQVAVLIPLAWLILSSRTQPGTRLHERAQRSRRARVWSCSAMLAGVIAMCLVPIILVGQGLGGGLVRIATNAPQTRMLLHEIFTSLGYALAAALLSSMAAARLLNAARRSRSIAVMVVVAALPGLVGSLVLGLALIQLLQQPLLRIIYKSPLSLATGLILFLLPRALLVRIVLWSSLRAGEHLARLLRGASSPAVCGMGRELEWQLRWRGEFWGVALLTYWGFFDLTIASLLAPVTIVSAPVMLYNQMHFGKNATLSALVMLTVLIPLAVFAAAAVARRLVFRWFWR